MSTVNATTTERESISAREQSSAFVHTIALGGRGELVDLQTGQPVEGFARLISRCRYGDKRAADEVADMMLEAAGQQSALADFIQRSHSEGKAVVITSHGLSNVPTASALIVQSLLERMNFPLCDTDGPPVIVDRPIAIPALKDVAGTEELAFAHPYLTNLVNYQGLNVLFVDDVLVTLEREKQTSSFLTSKCGASEVFFLYGGVLDRESYTKTNGVLEKMVVNREIDGSLQSLLPLLSDPNQFVVLQRTLQVILHPENKQNLEAFLRQLPDESVLTIVRTITHVDFTVRYNGFYQSSIKIIKADLARRGWVSDDGKLYRKQRVETGEQFALAEPHQMVVHTLESKKDIPLRDAELYSGMKYCDPKAVRAVADQMAESILADDAFLEAARGTTIYLTSSAYGAVPTAATLLTDRVESHLRDAGIRVVRFKVERKGQFAKQNFGDLDATQRAAALKARKLEIDSQVAEQLPGATVLMIDDLCATGSHEKAMRSILEAANVGQMFSAYYIKFTKKLMVNEPDTEEWLNRASAKSPVDFLGWMAKLGDESFIANARLIKMILTTSAEENQGISADQRVTELKQFLSQCPNQVLEELYAAATSADGYFAMSQYESGFQLLEVELLRRQLRSIEEINALHKRTAGIAITESKNTYVDMSTSHERNEIVSRYSLMKFGDPEQIQFFADLIAQKFIEEFDRESSELRQIFDSARDNHEHVVLFVPGSRNVPSASNFVLFQAIEQINIMLALQDLPTVICTHLPRLASNTANYAQLSQKERNGRPISTKTLLPGNEMYQHSIHVLFGDDVRITGATADRVRRDVMAKGALSFRELYAILIDPVVAASKPEIENALNTREVSGDLSTKVATILNHPAFQPVQRMVRLVLSESNRDQLAAFLHRYISNEALIKLYIATTGNDYLKNEKYRASGEILRTVLFERGLVTASGLLVRK